MAMTPINFVVLEHRYGHDQFECPASSTASTIPGSRFDVSTSSLPDRRCELRACCFIASSRPPSWCRVDGIRLARVQANSGGALCAATRRSLPLSSKIEMPNLASQMRTAFSSMVGNTGSRSPGRALNDLKHFRGSSLLLQASICALQFVEQSRILDGDDGLSGEVLDQLDLLIAERANFLAVHNDSADQFVFLQHRNGHKCPNTAQFNGRNNFRIAFVM